MTKKQIHDITGSIGPFSPNRKYWDIKTDTLVTEPPYPMYSYERPAYILWQAIYEGIRERGFTHKQAIEWLQSKGPRWALDGELGDKLRELGSEYAKTVSVIV
jgi:hypothetical protein